MLHRYTYGSYTFLWQTESRFIARLTHLSSVLLKWFFVIRVGMMRLKGEVCVCMCTYIHSDRREQTSRLLVWLFFSSSSCQHRMFTFPGCSSSPVCVGHCPTHQHTPVLCIIHAACTAAMISVAFSHMVTPKSPLTQWEWDWGFIGRLLQCSEALARKLLLQAYTCD